MSHAQVPTVRAQFLEPTEAAAQDQMPFAVSRRTADGRVR
jgi:hypothetical protein